MTDESEWGPWIEHDGKGHPLKNGQVYNAVFADLDEFTAVRGANVPLRTKYGVEIFDGGEGSYEPSWTWEYRYERVIRYRVRKPLGLTMLESLLENLPEEVDA